MARVIKIVFLGVALASFGCGPQPLEKPRIMGRDRVLPPQPIEPVPMPSATEWQSPGGNPAEWVPSRAKEKAWKAIIVHHSATDNGSMATFDSTHRNSNNWDGIGYNFVIGNGRGSGDGQVEVTYRWRDQVPGAHCGGTPENWANVDGIGICLVGDFTKTRPTYRQMESLRTLVKFLQQRYRIPIERIYGHGEAPGYTRGSVCPGRNFPMSSFKRSL